MFQKLSLFAFIVCFGLLAACGSGGGDGGDAGGEGGGNGGGVPIGGDPGPGPGSSDTPLARTVSGKLSTLAADGRIVDAGADQPVSLVVVDAEGTPGTELATARTAADGSFRFDLPAGQSVGAGLALVAPDGAGGRWRALVLGGAVDLGPASEAHTQEFVTARAARGSAFTESPQRLSRLQRNATLLMRLMNARSAQPQSAVAALRHWLRQDPAAAAAFASLAGSGALPATLGDIGGLFGAAGGAWEVVDRDQGRRTLSAVQVPGSSTDLYWRNTAAGAAPLQPARLRVENDGVSLIWQAETDPATRVLLDLIGANQVAAFSLETGVRLRLTAVDRATTGYDFDGDRREDRLQYRIDQTARGIETITAFGAPRQVLRVDYRSELAIVMSGGGRPLHVVEARSQWSLPFAGPVREESTVTSTDTAGRTTTLSTQRTTERAVVNSVSWPGGVHVAAVPLRVPAHYSFTTPLGVTDDLRLSFGGSVPGPCCILPNGLSSRDLTGAAADADIVVPNSGYGTRRFVSPDGTRLYLVTSQPLPPEFDGRRYAMDPAEAARHGAVIVRYNARTLQEEARIVLPPRPSGRAPGLAFARNMVSGLLISPVDPTHFVVAGVDAQLVRGTEVAPRFLRNDDSEAVQLDGRVTLSDFQVTLRGWDAARHEIWVELNGGGPLGRVAPISADGFDPAAVRPGLPYMFTLLGSNDLVFDHIGAGRAYAQGHRSVIDTTTGTVTRRLADSSDPGLRSALCARRLEQVLCSSGDSIYWLDQDLAEVSRLSLNNDLRALASGVLPSGPSGALFAPREGVLVYLGHDLARNAWSDGLVALQLTF